MGKHKAHKKPPYCMNIRSCDSHKKHCQHCTLNDDLEFDYILDFCETFFIPKKDRIFIDPNDLIIETNMYTNQREKRFEVKITYIPTNTTVSYGGHFSQELNKDACLVLLEHELRQEEYRSKS